MKLLIWGTGRIACNIINTDIDYENVIAFIDNNRSKKMFLGKPVIAPDDIINYEYTSIIVATIYANEIRNQIKILGINHEKVIYLYNNYEIHDFNEDYLFVANVLGEEYAKKIRTRYHMVSNVEIDEIEPPTWKIAQTDYDYVRLRTFWLLVDEIKRRKLKGEVAELGVYRGEFASYINAAFPDKTCYLFDTFESFDESELEKEIASGHCNKAFNEVYAKTSIQAVFEKMPNQDKVEIRKGLFPESLNGLETQFCFVSLDVDLEESTYAGLSYFYPRLENGGYLMLHDYNGRFVGVQNALMRFEADNRIQLSMVPICDAKGTVILTK